MIQLINILLSMMLCVHSFSFAMQGHVNRNIKIQIINKVGQTKVFEISEPVKNVSQTLQNLFSDVSEEERQSDEPVPLTMPVEHTIFETYIELARTIANEKQRNISNAKIKNTISTNIKKFSIEQYAQLAVLTNYLDVPVITDLCITRLAYLGFQHPSALKRIAKTLSNPDLEYLVAEKIPYCDAMQTILSKLRSLDGAFSMTVKGDARSEYDIRSISWNFNNTQLAFVINNTVYSIDSKTGKWLYESNNPYIGSYSLVTWNPKHNILAYTGLQRLFIVDKDKGKITSFDEHRETISSMSWNSLGTLLATGDKSGKVSIRDMQGNIQKIISLNGKIDHISWNSDDNTLACIYGPSNYIAIVDINREQINRIIERPTNSIAWSPDGVHFVCSLNQNYDKHTTQIWNGQTGKLEKSFDANILSDVSWPIKNIIATKNYDSVRVWDVRSMGKPELLCKLSPKSGELIYSMAWNSDNHKIAVGCSHGVIMVWDINKHIDLKLTCKHLSLKQIELLLNYYKSWGEYKKFNWTERYTKIGATLPEDLKQLLQVPPKQKQIEEKERD